MVKPDSYECSDCAYWDDVDGCWCNISDIFLCDEWIKKNDLNDNLNDW